MQRGRTREQTEGSIREQARFAEANDLLRLRQDPENAATHAVIIHAIHTPCVEFALRRPSKDSVRTMQAKAYVSCSPGKPGNIFALFYCESGADVYGWHIETHNMYFSAAFFMIESFYSERPVHLYRSIQDDVYSPWTIDYPPTRDHIRCPVPEPASHELERMQWFFVEDWLFFREDPDIESELQAYGTQRLPVYEVNIRSRRLQRLEKRGENLVYMPQGVDANIVQLVRKYWRLNEKIPVH